MNRNEKIKLLKGLLNGSASLSTFSAPRDFILFQDARDSNVFYLQQGPHGGRKKVSQKELHKQSIRKEDLLIAIAPIKDFNITTFAKSMTIIVSSMEAAINICNLK